MFFPDDKLVLQEVDKEIVIKRNQIEKEIALAASQLSDVAFQASQRHIKLSEDAAALILKFSQAVADAKELGLKY